MTSLQSVEPPLSLLSSTKPLVSINVNINAAWKKRNLIHPRRPLPLVLVTLSLNLSQTPLRQTWSLNLTLQIPQTPVNLMVLSRMPKKLVANKKASVSIAPIPVTVGPIVLVVSLMPQRLTLSLSFLLTLNICLPFRPALSPYSREKTTLKSPRGRRLE